MINRYNFSIKYYGMGLYYYGARYYDPRTSVWISTDPKQEKYPSVSTYAYCTLNPVRYTDPTGMAPEDGDPHDPLVSQFDSRIKIDVDQGVAELNLDNFSMFTRAKIKAMNEDMANWAPGEIGINTTVANFNWSKVTNFERSELASMDNTVGAVDPNYDPRVIPIGGTVLKKDRTPDRRYAGWNQKSINAGSPGFITGAKGMLVVNLINFSFEQYMFWAAINDKNKLESHTEALRTTVRLVSTAAARGDIPRQFMDKKSQLHIVNYVYQGGESSGYASIGSIGRSILKNRDSYNVIEKKK
ncbi:RHS repeat-associated core domain-containing protein [Dysgonomonas sp. GY617]|uniref:RHS repeat-associated core domain-containing protein n=1 Tax=Dysgonomonas sp. GY617 TaxID=2780420 RepID=UPI001883CE75|nr:RHS repeat-associated core domain-containing protein [Dysgonomonas sp. GY617]MBF0575568.1 hypothetical protein [Dysgonomonas sp. GY617]